MACNVFFRKLLKFDIIEYSVQNISRKNLYPQENISKSSLYPQEKFNEI